MSLEPSIASRSAITDRWLVALGLGAAAAALLPLGLGDWSLAARVAFAGAAFAAWKLRLPRLAVAAVVILTSIQAGAHLDAAAPSDLTGEHSGPARLVSDPEAVTGGVRVRAEINGDIIDLRAWGSPAGWLRPRLMGEVVELDTSLRALRDPPRWLIAQGLDGRGTVRSVRGWTEGHLHTRIANSLRRTIASGARSLDRDDHALFTGLVYGDDRAQPPLMLDDFDAAGLTHLVAVSGQNVAFTLAIVAPLLRRLGHRSRWIAIGAILLVFATMTRFEPSVLRASVMAAVASTGALIGTRVPSTRVLTLAVVALLVVRPMLVHSVAFQLSIAASAGILLWSARLARAIRGPRSIVEAIAVTCSAQLAVAPLLLWRFGTVPVAALPANLLAGPAAGPVMMWGMTAGWVAGLAPEPVAAALHVPTRAGVSWIAAVAKWSAMLPLGELDWPHVIALGGLGWAALSQADLRRRARLVACAVVVLAAPALVAPFSPRAEGPLPSGTFVARSDDETIAVLAGRPQQVLADLRRAGVGAIDLVVVDRSTFANADLVGWISERHDIGTVWAPAATMGVGEIIPTEATRHTISSDRFGPLTLGARVDGSTLTVHRIDGG